MRDGACQIANPTVNVYTGLAVLFYDNIAKKGRGPRMIVRVDK